MDYNKLIELRAIVSNRIADILENNNDFELSIKTLTSINEFLFKGIYYNSGTFRKYNIEKAEDILNGRSIDYHDYHTIPTYLRFIIQDEKKIDYNKLNEEEKVIKIAKLASNIWLTHPFVDENVSLG